MTCSEHQVYKRCETCAKTCSNPNPKCPTPCAMGCFCEEGYVQSPNGQCVKLENCPKAEEMVGAIVHVYQEPSIEDCAPDEEYFSCGWCEPSCSNPSPSCPIKRNANPKTRNMSAATAVSSDVKPASAKDQEHVCWAVTAR
ncbi:hypothetical protein HF086_001692 [Spodoptera exigua]|uniref:TIL domain-containing protein n=1 Tax=Spodoptera exigua TaxID=7107 RepID=A0A922SJR9_SPOEX|nr:hypothetical protein HF086_001692 [Spodoptera exigua]